MAKTVPLDAGTLAWARSVFAEHYAGPAPEPPPRLARREFAAFPFAAETTMRRHATLRSPDELRAFLRQEVPRHVYYSTAYYRFPDAPTMPTKEWLGADLIFDLDADHLRGAETLDYAAQLARVKSRLIDLVDDFLLGDFGIDPASVLLVFSGGRGYHVHVRDDRFLPLTSPERRELVDYVVGTGVEPMRAVAWRREDVRAGRTAGAADDDAPAEGGRRGTPRTAVLADPGAPGWPGRTTRAVLRELARWEQQGAKSAAAEMVGLGIPPARARRIARLLVDDGGAAKIRATRALDVFRDKLPEDVLEALVRQAAVDVQGETDAPVTTDIHRLIRLPGSLHGGTGFRVVPVVRSELDGFDPFRDAPLRSAADGTTPVTFREDVRYPFPDGGVRGVPGRTDELPTPQALFLVLRGEAELRPSPAP